MTALEPRSGPEKPEKDEKPLPPDTGGPFSGFPAFPGPGAASNPAPGAAAAAALAAVRAYRRIPPPKPPRAPRRKQDAPPDAADSPRARAVGHTHPTLPGVPPAWCEGVTLLASRPAPPTIPRRRWAALAAASDRLLRYHGAELHAARWDTIALFGLHPDAPDTNHGGWGLAWLLGEAGEVLDVAPDVIGMRREPHGWRMVCVRRIGPPPPGIVPAWMLD